MQKNYLFRVMAVVMIFLFSGKLVVGQTNPTTATLPVNFTSQVGATLPDYMAIHRFGTSSGTIPITRTTIDGNADLPNSTVNNSGGWLAEAEDGISILASGSNAAGAILFEFSTLGKENIQVSAVRWTKLNQDGVGTPPGSTKINAIGLQYRIGESGTWINVDNPSSSEYQTSTVGRTSGSTDIQTLPILANNKSIVQVRWVYWDVSGAGARDRLGLDDVSIIGTAISTTPELASISSPSIAEGNSGTTNLTFTASLTLPSVGSTVVTLSSNDVTATLDTDYQAIPTDVTILDGQTTATFDVAIKGDTDLEPNETFTVTGTLNSITKNGTGTILDDDAPVLPTLSINDFSINEGNSGTTNATFTVTLSAVSTTDVTFMYATANGTATTDNTDYTSTSGTAIITAGQTTTTILVPIVGDIVAEINETFTVNLTNPSGATIFDGQGNGLIFNEDLPGATKIHEIQGSSSTAALTGSQTVEGIVTRAFYGPGSLNGFYMQEEDADADANVETSEGIFVFNPPTQPVVGDKVSVTGTVIDFGTTQPLTEFSPTASVTIISSANLLPTIVNVTLPVANVTDLERYEGMLVTLKAATDNLVVTNNYELGRYGQIELAANDPTTNAAGTDARIDQYTQFNIPNVSGNAAYQAAVAKRTIYIDDANTFQNIDPIKFGRGGMPLSASNTLRTGDEVASVTAVLDQRFEGYRLQIGNSSELNILPTNERPTTPSLAGSPALVVGNMNVLNYFNGDGTGGGFPTDRGAQTSTEFTMQRDKIIAAIKNSGADVLSLNEMENDGNGTTSAIQDLVNGLNTATTAGTWQAIIPAMGTITATDAITCAMIFKPAKVMPEGNLAALTTGEYVQVGRAAIAQTFKQLSNNAMFTLVGGHFKSKGTLNAGTGNPDIGDGQGKNNGQRTRQAEQLAAWLATNPTGTTDPDYIILGDLNSYAKENPITTLESAGFTTLIPITNTSYQFNGAHGALDHALGNASLAAQVTDAKKWNINADEPTAIDYNITFEKNVVKTATQIDVLYDPDQYRNSDHDPVLVGLNLCVKPDEIVTTTSICSGQTYTWVVNGLSYTSSTTISAIGANCDADQTLVLTMDDTPCSDAICTTLPIDYANSSFMACSPSGYTVGVGVLMNNALNSMPNIFGIPTKNRTFTLNPVDVSSGNIYTMMASVSNASSKFGLGGASFDNVDTWPRVPLNSSGQLANVLFRNALALYFNLKNSTKLGNVAMTNIHYTQPLTACGAMEGTGVITSYQMPTGVITYLNNSTNGYATTVAGLYELANDALGGKTGVPNLSTIASAIDKINKAFNGCRLISTPSTPSNTFGTSLKVTENSIAFDAPAKGGLFVTLIEGDAATGNILGVTEIGSNGISGFEPIINNTYKLILGTDPEGSRTPQAPNGYKIVGEVVNYYNEDQTLSQTSNTGLPDGEIEIGTANTNAGAKVAAGNRIEVEYLLEPTTPLPLTLISFTGKKQNFANVLEWKTENEKAFDGFEIQKSEGGKSFVEIGFVKSGNVENYSFTDTNLSSTTNYYRLKMIDLNGSFALSKIIAIQAENESKTLVGTVYPNPVTDKTTFVEIITEKAGNWKITTFNTKGSLQNSSEIQLKEGSNKVSVELNNLSQGIYFLNLENENGEKFVRKVLKN